MANPPPQGPPPPKPRPSNFLRCLAIILAVLIFVVGLTVLIIWLAIKPKRLTYTIESSSVHGFNLSHDHLTANFDFVFTCYNPNHRVSIYYDTMEVTVFYDEQTVAFDTIQPFHQPHRNLTRLEVKPMAKSVALMGSVSRELRLEKSSGAFALDIRVRARIRFKVGVWKSHRRTLKILCSPVLVHFSSRKSFERTFCDIDL